MHYSLSIIHECNPGDFTPQGIMQSLGSASTPYFIYRVGLMLEYSTGELLISAAFMHHDDGFHGVLKQYAVVKELAVWARRWRLCRIDLWPSQRELGDLHSPPPGVSAPLFTSLHHAPS